MDVPGEKNNIQFSSSTESLDSEEDLTLDKANMPQTMSSETPSSSDNWTKQCPKHNNEMIQFYCHDHNALLCSVCVTLEHTPASCKVDFIPEVSDKIINSKEYQDTLTAIKDMTMEVNKILQVMKEVNDKSSNSLNIALKEIKEFRTKINQRLDELEKQVEEAAKVIQKENGTQLTRVEKECEDLLKSLKISSDAITQCNTSKQANDLFMEVKQAEMMNKDYEQSIAKFTALDVKKYTFEPNEAISNLLSKEKVMGTLKGRSINHLMPRKISNKDKICIKTSNDSKDCWITGMTLLTPNLLIITDYDNNVIKMVDINRMSVLDQHKLDSGPDDVSSVSHDEIAVTIPHQQAIQFMSAPRNNLEKKHAVEVDGRCRGISCRKDNIVVTFDDPAKVQILHINGTLLQTIQDENIFSSPWYVTTSNDDIYVSDEGNNTIIKLNWQGEVKGQYDCRSWPRGLTTSDDETVFVCFHDDNTIKEISEFFTKDQTVVEDVQCPVAVCWSAETCTLYTSSITSSPAEDNFIKIYKFSS